MLNFGFISKTPGYFEPFLDLRLGEMCLVCFMNVFSWLKIGLKSGCRVSRVDFFGHKMLKFVFYSYDWAIF